MRIRRRSFYFILILLLSGCVNGEMTIEIQNDTNTDSENMEEIIENDNRLTRVVAIVHEKNIVSGIQVKTFSRFHKEKIEKELTKQLEKKYEAFDVTVSADSKSIRELNKLMELNEKEKLNEKIEQLKSLLKEET